MASFSTNSDPIQMPSKQSQAGKLHEQRAKAHERQHHGSFSRSSILASMTASLIGPPMITSRTMPSRSMK